jgi:biopolymer transport protein ExbD
MTPLVDLGFLLLIFFMFLLTLQTPKVLEIVTPEIGRHCYLGAVRDTPWVTIIVSPHNKVSMYGYGWMEEKSVVFNNRPQMLKEYFAELLKRVGKSENRKTKELESPLIVLIKPEDTASYEDVITVLDMVRNLNIRQYGLVDITQSDIDFLKGL